MPVVPQLPPPVPPIHPQVLPIARTPFSPHWFVHDLSSMNVECPFCHALHWKAEQLTKSSNQNPKFGKCCLSGKIWLPCLDPPPPKLHSFLVGQDLRDKKFCQDIQKYNNALVMTSVGRKTEYMPGGGPYVFKIHGALSHHAGSLLPAPDQSPVFA